MNKRLMQLTALCLCGVMGTSLAGCSSQTQGGKETKAKQTEGKQTEAKQTEEQDAAKSLYQVTEENAAPELTMNDQPESSYWFPQQLLDWKAEEDPDFAFNVSRVPLAERVHKENLALSNDTQNLDTKVMAISIMNSSTSGNAPRGLNKVDCNTFTYWQYVDKLVYWGGSSGEGIIVPPSPDVTDLGHKNGVPVLGTVFFPQSAHGGKLEWLETFLQSEDGKTFPMADKLIEVAKLYGFDGWFINQESEGSEEQPLTKEHAAAMRAFIKYFKVQAPELELVYYDSMTNDGEMDWQNALTDKNDQYLVDQDGSAVADSMFLNFWWTEDALADQELLKASREKAEELKIDPYSLYAGVDVQANGYATPVQWKLLESAANATYTSLGIYCPNWAYTASLGVDEFQEKENRLWVNSKKDPTAAVEYSDDTQWRGVSTYVVEKSAVTKLPFTTYYNMGNGYSFFKNGTQISTLDWNNRSIGDILPTYRWVMSHEGSNTLTPSFSVGDSYYGGTCLKFRGDMGKDVKSTIKLFSADLPLEEGVIFNTTAKSNVETALNVVLAFDDGSEETIEASGKIGADWTTVTYDVSKYAGKKIRSISYSAAASEDKEGYELYLGGLSIYRESDVATAAVSNVSAGTPEFDEDAMYAGVRLTWESSAEVPYYEVYRVNQDKTLSLLGVTNVTNFYVNTLPRTDDTNKSTFRIVPVSMTLESGESAEVTMDWPDNRIPKANFTASQTLIGPGSSVTFTSTSSENTASVEWTLPGASTETSTDASVKVTYEKEGTYPVTLKAKNDSGEGEKTVEGMIVVTSELAADEALTLVSQGKDTEATAYVNENEAPPFAVDGDVTKKWCATGTPPHELTIDLGKEILIGQIGISHAEAGGESADMNTKSYKILVSADGTDYQEVVSVTRNTAGTTMDTFTPVSARYVKLSVIKPTQGSDSAARIYEVEVYGIEK